jgi:hypothetical protein
LICSVNPAPGAGDHVNARLLCFGVGFSGLDWSVWIQYVMEELQKKNGKNLLYADISRYYTT